MTCSFLHLELEFGVRLAYFCILFDLLNDYYICVELGVVDSDFVWI